MSNMNSTLAADIPADYRGIPFAAWLDIFLEYSICLSQLGRSLESYEICEAAKDAIVFYHSREDMFLIHICWCRECRRLYLYVQSLTELVQFAHSSQTTSKPVLPLLDSS